MRWVQLIASVLLAWSLVALALAPLVAAFIRLGKRRQRLQERWWSEAEQPAGRRAARARARGPVTVR